MSEDRFLLATDGRGIATLTLNRPEVANAYDVVLNFILWWRRAAGNIFRCSDFRPSAACRAIAHRRVLPHVTRTRQAQ